MWRGVKYMHIQKLDNLQEIISFLPENAKKEAIDFIEFLYKKYTKDMGDKITAFKIIENYKGKVEVWTREELHER